ncbi:MAG TPA: ABC transporter substrate-binding protein [Acidimicrobiales bacterium]|nr:ABC transporter substrate-binding protein [Acidimicrobiales bacterium]
MVATALVGASLLQPLMAGASLPKDANPNGILKYGIDLNSEFDNTFSPEKSFNPCGFAILSNIYASGLRITNQAFIPNVIQSWSTTPNTVTLHIRPGVVFSNGDPVDANAIKTSLLYSRQSPLLTTLTAISTIDVLNPLTLVLNLSNPIPGDVVQAMYHSDGTIYDPSTISTDGTKPVGAGPFVLKSYQLASSISLVANPKYWHKGQYLLGGVDFVQVSLGPQVVTALESGAIDMATLEPDEVAAVKAQPDLAAVVGKSYDYVDLQMRQNAAPFNNSRVRAALEYAVDRNALNRVVYDGLGEPAYQPFPSWSPGYNKAVGNKYTYQPAKAKAMLKAAGFPKGISFTLVIPGDDPSFAQTSQIIQQQAKPAGFTIKLQQVDPADLLTDVYIKGEGDALLSEQLSNGPDLANNFENEFLPIGFLTQHFGTANPLLAPYIKQALQYVTAQQQGPFMQKAGALAMSLGAEVPLVFQPSLIGYNKTRVGGTVQAPIGQCQTDLAGIYIKK